MSLRVIAGTVLGLACGCASAAPKPNIVMILIDDVGVGWLPPYAKRLAPDDIESEVLQAYASARSKDRPVDVAAHIAAARDCMPTLEKLAGEGAVFDRCFATASLCAPSRAGLLTGMFQQRWGAYSLADVDEHGIPSDRVLVSELLQAAGYRCGAVGKWHVARKDETIKEKAWTQRLGGSLPIPPGYGGRWPELAKALEGTGYRSSSAPGQHPLDRGFDYSFGYNSHDSKYYGANDLWENRELVPPRPPGEFLTDLFNAKCVAFIERATREKKPFFLYYAPMTLHGGIVPPPARYSEPFSTGIPFSDEYAGHLRALDEGIRQIIGALESSGQLDNTLIIVSSDNGCTLYNVPPYNAPNRGGKGTGWLGGLNVPLVVWRKGVVQPAIHKDIASLADLLPTIMDSAGLPSPEGIDGKSLFPLLTGRAKEGPRRTLGSAGLHSSRWSYCYDAGGDVNDRDAGDCPLYAWYMEGDRLLLRTTAIRPGLYRILPGGMPARTQLFDLSSDRSQRRDLAPAQPEIARNLEEGSRRWLSEMKSPLTSHRQDFNFLADSSPIPGDQQKN